MSQKIKMFAQSHTARSQGQKGNYLQLQHHFGLLPPKAAGTPTYTTATVRMAPDLGALYQDLLVPQEAWLSSPPLVLDCQEHVTIPNFILSCPPLADTRETGSCLLKGPQGITTYIYPSPDCNTLSWLHPVFTISLSNLKTAPKSDGVLVSSITPEGQEPWGPHSIDDSSRAGTPYTYSGRVFPAFLFPF